MCGINGFVGHYTPDLIERMNARISHRGPDGGGVWMDPQGTAGLGHRRLSIIDLSEAASQPMASAQGNLTVVFNGEIYNFKELSEELKAKGYIFNENSDTAILMPLYQEYGVEMLQKLSGIFAFAIWDKHNQKLFAARDHLGMKPFYYAETEKGVLFSSELKALMASDGVRKDIDHEAMFSYMTYLWCPGERTMFKDIRKLLPGHFMMFDKGKLHLGQWYEPPMPEMVGGKPQYDYSKTPSDLQHLLDEVVSEQLVSDVPVGTFLSGGVDSSAIAASMNQVGQGSYEAFCISFQDNGMASEGFGSDIQYARKVADKLDKIHLNDVVMDANSLNGLKEMVYFLDEPQADPAPLYVRAISKIARQMGIKVLMSGTGGDDIFSGYRRHQAIMTLNNLRFIPEKLQMMGAKGVSNIFTGTPLGRRLNKFTYLAEGGLDQSMIRSFHYTEPGTLTDLLVPELQRSFAERSLDHLEKVISQKHTDQHPLNRQLFAELHGFLPDHNLNYTDKLGMAEGIEIRVPLLDPKVLKFASDLPIGMKMKGQESKYILKKSQENRLSKEILYRSKAGFGAPVRTWIAGEAHEHVRDVLFSEKALSRGIFDKKHIERLLKNTKSGAVDGAYTILSLLVLEYWFKMFLDEDGLFPSA